MVLIAFALLTISLPGSTGKPQPSAAEIMRRVGENQDRDQKARSEFVYQQKTHRTMRRKDGKLLHEEFWVYSVTPGPKGTSKKLVSVKGRYLKKGTYVSFDGLPVPESLVRITFQDEDENNSRDGLDKDLFPLTSEQQKKYSFQLVGDRVIHDRPAYRIEFRPTDPKDYGWVGEASIDEEEFQPVSVYTRMSRKLPAAVRTVLGTDVPGLGYNITYTRVDKDLWFPATYGTEFSLKALFFLHRTFTESVENTNFQRVAVDSKIEYAGATK